MAKGKSAKVAPATEATDTVETHSPNMDLLKEIVSATLNAETGGFMYVSPVDALALIQLGYAEQNAQMADATGKLATRATAEGQKMVTANTQETSAPAAMTAAAKPAAPKFTLVTGVPMPDKGTRGPSRNEAYPFSQMEVGQAFFIPATEAKPNPQTTYASTVASARARYATKTGEKRTNRKGREVDVLNIVRDFAIKRVEDGAQFGAPGVAGAAIWRTK